MAVARYCSSETFSCLSGLFRPRVRVCHRRRYGYQDDRPVQFVRRHRLEDRLRTTSRCPVERHRHFGRHRLLWTDRVGLRQQRCAGIDLRFKGGKKRYWSHVVWRNDIFARWIRVRAGVSVRVGMRLYNRDEKHVYVYDSSFVLHALRPDVRSAKG